MVFTNKQIEAIQAAALPIDFGSVTIHISATNNHIDIDALSKTRVQKEEATQSYHKERTKQNA